jgi:hypothetical protein
MATEGRNGNGKDALAQMRTAFQTKNWAETLGIYERLRDRLKGQRGLRIEATCLAARALIAQKDRSGARSLLKWVAAGEYTKAVHYHFLAQAYLDLNSYREAARACERAAALSEAATN